MPRLTNLLSVGKNWSAEPLESTSWSDPHPPLRVVTLDDRRFLSVEPQSNGSFRYSGYLYELWEIVARKLNLKYQMVPLAVSDYGSLGRNGTWTGLVGELAYGHADVALASLDMTSDRARVTDFLDACPVDQPSTGFLVQRGFREGPQLFSLVGSLLKPLETNVWWALLVSLLAMSIILRISLRSNRGRAERQQTVEEMPWSVCLLHCYMSMVGQGWSTTPSSLAARAVTISCWILGIIIYASYTANLISTLTVVTEELPIKSLEEFLERPDWKLAVHDGMSEINEWRSSSDEHERALYRRYVSGEGVIPMDSISTSAATEEGLMLYADLKHLQEFLGPAACLFAPMPRTAKRSGITYIGVAKGRSTLRRRINQLLLKMRTGGLISRLRRRWRRYSGVVCERPTEYKPISFSDTLAVLALVPLSLCASMVSLGLERALRLH